MAREEYYVVRERFLLDQPNVYQIQGILPENCKVTAMLDRKALETKVIFYPSAGILSGVRVDPDSHAKYAGLQITMPEDFDRYRTLSVFYTYEGISHRWFRFPVSQIAARYNKPQYYIEKVDYDKAAGKIAVTGWAVSGSLVQVRIYKEDKTPAEASVSLYIRADVAEMYGEAIHLKKPGFLIEAEGISGNWVYLVMRDKEGRKSVERIGLGPAQKAEAKMKSVLSKTMRSLAVRGPKELARKGTDVAVRKGIELVRQKGPAFMVDYVNRKAAQRHAQSLTMTYDEFIQKHLRSEEELQKQRNHVFEYMPKISIVVPLYCTDPVYLTALVDSVKAQTYSNWELCLSDGSGEPSPIAALLDEIEASDSRIRVIRHTEKLRIAQNTNSAIEEATGDYIGFADHDDAITPDALFEVVKVLNEDPEAELIYSDEDKMSGKGTTFMEPHFKPDYNPDLLYTVNYICHFLVVKRELVDKVGMLRPEYDGAQDYDFILRCTENTEHIRHIPRILYHWRAHEQSTSENPESKGYAFTAGQKALQAHFDRVGIPASVMLGEFPGLYRTKYQWADDPLVSILIPNKDNINYLKTCIESIVDKSSYQYYEIIVIENNSTEPETFEYYKKLEAENDRVRVVYWKGTFNYSAINNFGAAAAKGEYLLLLNNDTQVINENWIEELLGYCMRPDVGIVGARLYYSNDTIQHAGVIFGFGSIAGHAFVQQPRKNTGYCHRIICAQDYSAVTAACMMVRRAVFDEVGGLSEDLAVAFNDVDFCVKVRHAGYLVVYNPYCELYHFESISRGYEDTPEKIERFGREIATVDRHWPGIFQTPDPYYNPNLSLETQDFSLKRI